jgi:hypothetical protein
LRQASQLHSTFQQDEYTIRLLTVMKERSPGGKAPDDSPRAKLLALLSLEHVQEKRFWGGWRLISHGGR